MFTSVRQMSIQPFLKNRRSSLFMDTCSNKPPANAGGFRSFENYRGTILLQCGKLDLKP